MASSTSYTWGWVLRVLRCWKRWQRGHGSPMPVSSIKLIVFAVSIFWLKYVEMRGAQSLLLARTNNRKVSGLQSASSDIQPRRWPEDSPFYGCTPASFFKSTSVLYRKCMARYQKNGCGIPFKDLCSICSFPIIQLSNELNSYLGKGKLMRARTGN